MSLLSFSIYEETFKVNLFEYLVDWARQHKLVWTIENDIFIMRSQSGALMWREIIRKFG